MAVVLDETVKNNITNWESYDTVKNWKESLATNSDSMRLTTGTYNGMKTWFPRFLKSTINEECPNGLNPDELIAEAVNDPKTISKRLKFAFWFCQESIKSQDEDSRFNNAVTGIYGNVRGFYSHNLPIVLKIKTPKYRPRTVMITDGITPLTEITTNLDGVKIVDIDRKIFKKFMQILSLKYKVVVTGILSSGMDTGDIVKVTVGMIRDQKDHERIFFSNFRSKTGEFLNTFWSKEATAYAREYVETERSDALDSEPLLVNSFKQQKRDFFELYHRKYTPNDDSLLPLKKVLSGKRIARKLRISAKDIVSLKPGVQSPLRPKKYRKLFSDACDKAKIGENKRRIFMGKSDKSDKVYAGQSRHELELFYEIVEQYVTIYREESKIEIENQNMREENKILTKKLTEHDEILQQMIKKETEKTEVIADAKTKKMMLHLLKENNLI